MSEENPDDVEPVDDERVGFSEEVFGEEFNIGWICKGLRRKDILSPKSIPSVNLLS